jgi:hypothetical protein
VPCQLDPDLLQAVTSVPTRAAPTPAERDDRQTLRNNGESGLAAIEATLKRREVERVDHLGGLFIPKHPQVFAPAAHRAQRTTVDTL